MELKDRISEDMKIAMRARDATRLETIRMLRAAIQRKEVDDRVTLEDDGVLAVLQKQIKQGQDSIAQFQAGGRDDLVTRERAQLEILRTYMPEPMDPAEIDRLVTEAMGEIGATSMKDMGRIIALLKPRLQGKADLATISQQIKTRLQG